MDEKLQALIGKAVMIQFTSGECCDCASTDVVMYQEGILKQDPNGRYRVRSCYNLGLRGNDGIDHTWGTVCMFDVTSVTGITDRNKIEIR